MVIFYDKLNEQNHFVEHEHEIASLVVSSGNLVASGEKGSNPAIRIWDIHTRKTVLVLKGEHKSDVYLLAFIRNDTHLVSCSLRTNTPVIVHDVEKGTVVFSYWVDELVRQIVPNVFINENK